MVSEALKSILEKKKDVEEALEAVRVQLDFLEGRYVGALALVTGFRGLSDDFIGI